jgi:hypothetical protein
MFITEPEAEKFEMQNLPAAKKHDSGTSSVLHNIIIESSFNAGEYEINFTGFKLIRYA